jgi:hypothetical protein
VVDHSRCQQSTAGSYRTCSEVDQLTCSARDPDLADFKESCADDKQGEQRGANRCFSIHEAKYSGREHICEQMLILPRQPERVVRTCPAGHQGEHRDHGETDPPGCTERGTKGQHGHPEAFGENRKGAFEIDPPSMSMEIAS